MRPRLWLFIVLLRRAWADHPHCVNNKPELLARASLYYCPNDLFLQLAQREFPCATTFLDIGGNKGYTAVELLASWAPRAGVSPSSWWRAHVNDSSLPQWSDELRKGRRIGWRCGSCHECLSKTSPKRGCGNSWSPGVRIHSFDGSPTHVRVARRVWLERFATSARAGASAEWDYVHAAVADVGGGFVKFSDVSSELGSIVATDKAAAKGALTKTVLVPVTTVDAHVHAHELAVDVLKIDTEGYDGLVLLGANETLAQPSLKLVFFEYAVAPPWFERRDTFARALAALEQNEFECYLVGKLARTVRLTGCNDPRWDLFHRRSLLRLVANTGNTNVFCPSRRNAPGLVNAYDDLSVANVDFSHESKDDCIVSRNVFRDRSVHRRSMRQYYAGQPYDDTSWDWASTPPIPGWICPGVP